MTDDAAAAMAEHEAWVRRGIDYGGDHYGKLGYLVPCESGPRDGDDGGCSFVHDTPTDHLTYFAAANDVPADARGPVGMLEYHRDKRDPTRWCGGMVTFSNAEGQEPGHHTLVTVEPLHVEASIACPVCGSHGYIRDGRWSDA